MEDAKKKGALCVWAAADMGLTEAQFRLGRVLWYGVLGDPFDWGKFCSEIKDTCIRKVDTCIEKIDTNLEKRLALFWLEEAAEAGDVESARLLGVLYAHEVMPWITSQKRWEKAVHYWQLLAKGNDDWAMYCLGTLLIKPFEGAKCSEESFEEGVNWLKKAGELGLARAWLELGVLAGSGKLDEKEPYSRAKHYFEKAFYCGAPEGAARIGRLYELGHLEFEKGSERAMAEALQWYERAASAGSVEARLWVAKQLLKGGVVPDTPERRTQCAQWLKNSLEGRDDLHKEDRELIEETLGKLS